MYPRRNKFDVGPYLFMAPVLILYTLIVVYCVVQVFALSFQHYDVLAAQKDFVGLKNFNSMFNDEIFFVSFRNNLLFVAVVTALPIVIGLLIASSVDSLSSRKVSDVLRGLYYMPSVIPAVAIALIWSWFYSPMSGLLNTIIRTISGNQGFLFSWLGDARTALWSIMTTRSWMTVGFSMLIFLAGMRAIPAQCYEAARIDGASNRQCFLYITIPLLKPSFATLLLLLSIGAFKEFTLIYIMTVGGPYYSTELLVTHMYKRAFVGWDLGYGSAVAVILFVTVFFTALILRRIAERISSEY